MAPVTQIMYFKTSSFYHQNPARLISELAIKSSAAKIKGLSKAYLDFDTEDQSTTFWVFEWTNKSAHDTYYQTDTFKATQAAARQVFASRPTHTFAGFSNTSRIFPAPATEFVTFTLKSGIGVNALQPLVKQLQAKLQGTPKFYGSSWALVVDKPNAHWDVVSSGPLKEIIDIDEVKKVADLWLVHAILTQYKSWISPKNIFLCFRYTLAVWALVLSVGTHHQVTRTKNTCSRKRTAVSLAPVLGSPTKTHRTKAEATDSDVRDENDDEIICDGSADYLEFVFTCRADPVSHKLDN
ncbi:hypothetical protein BDR03DRAFT_1001931 [Suillus americanus]|nr:hypothetical protein BDR03DRAFT_1001931 [Suillus americanus]